MIELVDDGPEIAGREVVAWADQRTLARLLDLSPRWLRELRDAGLPDGGRHGRALRYPLPHAIAWFMAYRHLGRGTESVARLSIETAFPIYDGIVTEGLARGTRDLILRSRR